MINGSKGHAELPNRKTGIGSVHFHMVVLSLFKTFNLIFLEAYNLNVLLKITLSVDIIKLMFI